MNEFLSNPIFGFGMLAGLVIFVFLLVQGAGLLKSLLAAPPKKFPRTYRRFTGYNNLDHR